MYINIYMDIVIVILVDHFRVLMLHVGVMIGVQGIDLELCL
jgi:hypothetical protein